MVQRPSAEWIKFTLSSSPHAVVASLFCFESYFTCHCILMWFSFSVCDLATDDYHHLARGMDGCCWPALFWAIEAETPPPQKIVPSLLFSVSQSFTYILAVWHASLIFSLIYRNLIPHSERSDLDEKEEEDKKSYLFKLKRSDRPFHANLHRREHRTWTGTPGHESHVMSS